MKTMIIIMYSILLALVGVVAIKAFEKKDIYRKKKMIKEIKIECAAIGMGKK